LTRSLKFSIEQFYATLHFPQQKTPIILKRELDMFAHKRFIYRRPQQKGYLWKTN
jgi:hypothetical protein